MTFFQRPEKHINFSTLSSSSFVWLSQHDWDQECCPQAFDLVPHTQAERGAVCPRFSYAEHTWLLMSAPTLYPHTPSHPKAWALLHVQIWNSGRFQSLHAFISPQSPQAAEWAKTTDTDPLGFACSAFFLSQKVDFIRFFFAHQGTQAWAQAWIHQTTRQQAWTPYLHEQNLCLPEVGTRIQWAQVYRQPWLSSEWGERHKKTLAYLTKRQARVDRQDNIHPPCTCRSAYRPSV